MTEDNTKHTPRDWTVWHDEFGSRRHMTRLVIRAEGKEICEVQQCPEAEANARLIAAAPGRAVAATQMLAALKNLVGVVENWEGVPAQYEPRPKSVMHQALAAIAKAEAEEIKWQTQ